MNLSMPRPSSALALPASPSVVSVLVVAAEDEVDEVEIDTAREDVAKSVTDDSVSASVDDRSVASVVDAMAAVGRQIWEGQKTENSNILVRAEDDSNEACCEVGIDREIGSQGKVPCRGCVEEQGRHLHRYRCVSDNAGKSKDASDCRNYCIVGIIVAL